MTAEDIQNKVVGVLIEKMGVNPSQITPDLHLVKDLGMDSLDYTEIVMEFEQAFGIRIPDTDAQQLQTIKDAVAYIQAQLSQS